MEQWADAGRIGALGISAGSTAVLRCAIGTCKLAAGIAVATFLGHYVGMPDGPAKQTVDHLDTLLAGGTVEAKGRGSVVYHFGSASAAMRPQSLSVRIRVERHAEG